MDHSKRAHGQVDGVVATVDGRRIRYRQTGAIDGTPLFALHGTPGSRLKFSVADAIAADLGIRLIAPDRWGYGGTDPHPRPGLSAFAADIAYLADRLGIGTFAVMGVSGGGPYAAAVAAELPVRVTALALAAPVGPIAGEPDDEISRFHRFCFGPLGRRPALVGSVFRALRAALALSPELGMKLAMVRAAASDRLMLSQGDVRVRLSATFAEGLRQGIVGPVIDLELFGRPWDVDVGRIGAPTAVWLGSEDQNVPVSAARRLAARVPGCDLVELPGEGHLWVARNYHTVIGWVARNQKGAALATPSN